MFENIPDAIKGIQHYMKLAEDHDQRNILISYYARMCAVQVAMKIIPGAKPPEVSQYLIEIMDWLETTKKEHKDVEGIANDTVAQAMIEDYTLKIYNVAYDCDCNGRFTKNVVKAYYTVGLLCEVLQQFGPLSDDLEEKGKISKYRATYIHNMLKQGLPPQRINETVVESDEQEAEHVLTHDEINERRKQRGEDPLPTSPRPNDDDAAIGFNLPSVPNFEDTTPDDVGAASFIPSEPTPPIVRPSPAMKPSSGSSDASAAALDPDQTEKAIKYCKWASSALNYDDIGTAIVNLERALYLCKNGHEKPT